MPNFDTGHYFLTLLSPIKQGAMDIEGEDGQKISYVQNLKQLLNALQTAHQSPATQPEGVDPKPPETHPDGVTLDNNPFPLLPETEKENEAINSPFVQSKRTHICRFMVLDDTIYNGRNQSNALLTKLRMKLQKVKVLNPLLQPQPVDRLSCAYLMFTAEIDASLKPEDGLPDELSQAEQDEIRDTYVRELYETRPAEIAAIYNNCEGFDATDKEGCVEYMKACQVETTMPFNDYWLKMPPLKSLPMHILRPLVLVPLGITLLALLGWLFRLDWFPLGWLFGWSAGWTFIIGLLLSAAALYGVYRYILSNGNKPMPASEYGDLPSVLKSLYIQQHFADFAIAAQGKNDDEALYDDEVLYKEFGQFIDQHQPANKMSPSQLPGVIASKVVVEKGEMK